MHSHGQVNSFDMRRGNSAPVRPSNFDVWDRSDNLTAAVPAIGIDAAIDFVKLPEIHILSEVLAHRAHVGVVLIGRDLIAASRALPKVADEGMSVHAVAGTDVMADEQLRFGVDCQPDHSAAPFLGIVFAKVRFPRVNVAPHFIQLDKSRRDILHFGIRYLAGLLCCREHQRKNRMLVQTRKPGDRPHAHTLKHERQNLCRSFRIGIVRSEFRSGSGKCSAAGLAAPALNAAFTVVTELSAGSVRASDAGHGFSPLDCCGEKPQNEFGSGSWLTPRTGLAPPTAPTGSGALIVSYLGWWLDRDLYGLTGSESDLDSDHAGFILPESPVPAG